MAQNSKHSILRIHFLFEFWAISRSHAISDMWHWLLRCLFELSQGTPPLSYWNYCLAISSLTYFSDSTSFNFVSYGHDFMVRYSYRLFPIFMLFCCFVWYLIMKNIHSLHRSSRQQHHFVRDHFPWFIAESYERFIGGLCRLLWWVSPWTTLS